MANIYSIKLNESDLLKLTKHYEDFVINNLNEYAIFSAKKDGVLIEAYRLHGDGFHKVVFKGKNAYLEAKIFSPLLSENEVLVKEKIDIEDIDDQIGSDEVGTGDFFGPIVVCAAYVSKKDIRELSRLGITDSKKMSDETILDLGPQLIKRFHYSQMALENEKYNELIINGYNMNTIKSKMHNQVLINMHKKFPTVKSIYVDKFVDEKKYFEYNLTSSEVLTHVVFKTKGELRYPSVALASCIARYSFLLKMEKIGKKYHVEIPFGASPKVDDFANNFVKKHSLEELNKIVKTNFKNYETLKEKLNEK